MEVRIDIRLTQCLIDAIDILAMFQRFSYNFISMITMSEVRDLELKVINSSLKSYTWKDNPLLTAYSRTADESIARAIDITTPFNIALHMRLRRDIHVYFTANA
jgi:hypothetical protein